MNKWNRNQLAQVVTLYYEKNISQKDISTIFRLSKMTISRMIQKAKELNIINIDIVLPFKIDEYLGKKIKKKYSIDEAIVVKKDVKKTISALIGKVWAFYMGISDLNNKTIGLGLGNVVGSMVSYITPIKTRNTHIIQLMGGLTDVSETNPFWIVQEMCKKLKAEGTFLTSPATVSNEKTRNRIISSSYLSSIDLNNKCDMAIFGAGDIDAGVLLSQGLVKKEELKELKEKGGVGDILGHCFDKKGNFISSCIDKRLVSIPIDKLMSFKRRVCLAGGSVKRKSLKGALFSGIIDTIVCDEKLAQEII